MNHPFYYGCSGGCRDCPRMRQCFPAAAPEPAAVPAMAAAEMAPDQGDTVWTAPVEETVLSEFLAVNPESGLLRIQAFRGDQAIPLEGVQTTVYKQLDGQEHVFFEGMTDRSGIIDNIRLPAPARSESLHPGEPDPYATYQLRARFANFNPLDTTVDIFQGIKTVQPIQLRLRME